MDLFLQQGLFWELVHGLRDRRGIVPVVQLPPSPSKHHDLLLPEGAPDPPKPIGRPPEEEELLEKWWSQEEKRHEFKAQWGHDLRSILEQVVPERYLGGPIHGHIEYETWQNFAAACVLYDPPDTQLLAFAKFSDPPPYSVGLPGRSLSRANREEFVSMTSPPIKTLRDPNAERADEARTWDRILKEIQRRHLEPLGLDISAMLLDIYENCPELLNERSPIYQQSEARYYIEVDEHTTEADVKRAFRTIAAAQGSRTRGSKPERDPLLAVQCAVLYDRHNLVDTTDKRRREWPYWRLAEEFGLASERAARDYVNLGREILEKSR